MSRLANRSFPVAIAFLMCLGAIAPAEAQSDCQIPPGTQDIVRCENGFAIGPGDIVVGFPIADTEPEAFYTAGLAAANREDWRAAIAYFTEAHQRAHLVPRYMYNLGLAHARAGNGIPAIAWLSAYLIADPETQARDSVLRQIAELERSERQRVDRLWARVDAVILAYRPPPEGGLAKWQLYDSAWLGAAMAGDVPRAERLVRATVAAANNGEVPRHVLDRKTEEMWHYVRWGAVEDGDLAMAEEVNRRLDSPPGYEDGLLLERLRRGESVAALNLNRLSAAYLGGFSRCGDLCPELTAMRVGNVEEARRIAQQNLSQPQEYHAVALAALGWDDEAISLLENSRANVGAWSTVGEILLLWGGLFTSEQAAFLDAMSRAPPPDVADAPRLSDVVTRTRALFTAEHGEHMAEAFRLTSTMDRNESAEVAERSDAIIRGAEDADDHAALQALRSHTLRTLDRRDFLDHEHETPMPQSNWIQSRFDGPALLAEFHFNRGRVDRAVRMAWQTDSLRRLRFFDYALQRRATGYALDSEPGLIEQRELALAAASDGRDYSDVQRRHVEDGVIVAISLPGSSYDLAGWLDHTGRLPYPALQVLALREAADSLTRALRRVQVAYRNSGGTWPGRSNQP